MAGKKKEIQLHTIISNQNQWDEMLQTKGIVVIDVYQAWCGPCKAVLNLFRKLRNNFSEDNVLHFAVAEVDSIETLKPFRKHCEPVFLFSVLPGLMETESLVNLCDLQDSVEDASRQLPFFFPNFHINKVEHTLIKDDGFQVALQKEIILSEEQVRTFYKEHVDQDYFSVLLEQMTSGPTLLLALTGENAVSHWRVLLGPKTLEEAKEKSREYAIENVPINQLHGSSTPSDAQKELEFFFPEEQTFALIKPDAAKTHKGSQFLQDNAVDNGAKDFINTQESINILSLIY
ncbi:thioredoxin domain-containing protein 6-like [Acridotheres tristis]